MKTACTPSWGAIFCARMLSQLRALRRAERGIAAVEAALLIPLLAFTLVGFMELYQYHRAAALLDRSAFTLANGISIQRDLYDRGDCSRTTNVCTYHAIAADLMQPLNYRRHGQAIFSVYAATEPSGNNPAEWEKNPEWRRAYKGDSLMPGIADAVTRVQTDDFPPANRGDTIIVVEMFYDHQPFVLSAAFWETLGGQRRLYSRAYFRPRFSDIRELGQ